MEFVSEVSLFHEDLVLVSTIAAEPATTFRYERECEIDGSTLYFISVFGGQYADVEDAMEDDHTVAEWTRIATFSNRAIYQIESATDLSLVPPHCTEQGLFVHQITSDDGNWLVRVHIPDRDLLSTFLQYYRDNGVELQMKELYGSTFDDESTYFLTDRQQEILTIAYEGGYFDVPRRMSQDDLAQQLEISTSAVSQRLRRAISTMMSTMLEEQPGSNGRQ